MKITKSQIGLHSGGILGTVCGVCVGPFIGLAYVFLFLFNYTEPQGGIELVRMLTMGVLLGALLVAGPLAILGAAIGAKIGGAIDAHEENNPEGLDLVQKRLGRIEEITGTGEHRGPATYVLNETLGELADRLKALEEAASPKAS